MLQVLLLATLVAAGTVGAVLESRNAAESRARDLVMGVARTMVHSPFVRQAAASDDPPSLLQPYAETVRRDTGTDFVVVMAPDRTR